MEVDIVFDREPPGGSAGRRDTPYSMDSADLGLNSFLILPAIGTTVAVAASVPEVVARNE